MNMCVGRGEKDALKRKGMQPATLIQCQLKLVLLFFLEKCNLCLVMSHGVRLTLEQV